MAGLWPALSTIYATVDSRTRDPEIPASVPVAVEQALASTAVVERQTVTVESPCAESPFRATVLSARLLTQSDYPEKRIFEIEFDLADYPGFQYHPGDAIAVFAHNPPAVVSLLLNRLGLDESPLHLQGDNLPKSVLSAKSAREILSNCLDITSAPRKTLLKALAGCCTDVEEQTRLNFLASADVAGRAAYNEYISHRPSLLDILTDFPSSQPSIELLAQQLPPLQPRSYSVVSAPSVSPHRVRVAFSVVQYKARGQLRDGLCTPWLAEQCIDVMQGRSVVPVSLFLRPSNDFRLPAPDVPLILIGAGTGISPFVSFVQQRHAQHKAGSEIAETWVFFGCRHADGDFIYREELMSAADCGVITRFVTAFSRDQIQKQYATHKLQEAGDDVARLLLQQNATVFVCGDAKGVVKSVREAMAGILEQHGGMDAKQAQQKLLEMTKTKRYVLDIWG